MMCCISILVPLRAVKNNSSHTYNTGDLGILLEVILKNQFLISTPIFFLRVLHPP